MEPTLMWMEGNFRADGNKIKNMEKVFILRKKFKDGKEVNLSDISFMIL